MAKTLTTTVTGAVVLALAGLPAAQAQERGADSLQEITVTARKREESLLNVPVSIAVVSGEALRDSAVAQLEALAPTIPNFHFAEAVSGNDQIFMRGIGSGVNSGFENSVGQVIDGLFIGRSRFGRALFMDVAQVEILKGPQGALIGKNTTAGAVNIRTARPTETFEGYIVSGWQFEGDEGSNVEGAVSGPLGERVRGRLAFRREDKDGYVFNVVRKRKEMDRQSVDVRGTLQFAITEDLEATLLVQHGDQTRAGRAREVLNCSAGLRAALAPTGEDCTFNLTNSAVNLRNGVEEPALTNTKGDLVNLTLNLQTALGTLTSVSGYVQYDTRDSWDGDLISFEGSSIDLNESFEQFSQEVRLASDADGPLDYIVGAYFQKADQDNHFKIHANFAGPAPLPTLPAAFRATNNRVSAQTTESSALFGQLTWQLAEQWDLTGGFRYTIEDKDGRHREFPTVLYTDTPRAAPPGGPAANSHDIAASRSEKQFTPNAVLQWRPRDGAMAYFSIGRGFKGGGFDHTLSAPQALALQRYQFKNERVTAYELGTKFAFPAQRLQFTAAIFRSDFDDLQVSSLLPDAAGTIFKVGNAAAARSEGVEFEGRWVPIPRLRLAANVGYLRARYTEFRDAQCYTLQTAALGCVNTVQNLTGKPLQFAPKIKGSIDAQYRVPLSAGLEMTLSTRAYYSDRFAMTIDLDPLSFQESYTKYDASVALQGGDGRWRVALIGQNLGDKLTSNFGNTGPGDRSVFRFAEPPRGVVLQGRIEF
jgi:outer membrane receptor protein involved in Fe transport